VTGPDEFGQLSFAHMPTRLFACTPSRLAAFDCPRRYRFTYVDRPAPPRGQPWAHNILGATVHVALRRWWLQPRSRRTPEEGARLVRQYWQNLGFRDARQSERVCAEAADWVRHYLIERVDPDVEPVGVERSVSTHTELLAVSGRVDRIDDRDGELVVVDYKSGPRPRTTADARRSPALALYVLGVRATLRRVCTRVELHHLPTATVAAFEHTDESLAAHVAAAEQKATQITAATDAIAGGGSADDSFPPVPGPECGWCDFRRHCPAGQQASPELDPWAGLAQPADA
jgi:putative RecB family exonuclease